MLHIALPRTNRVCAPESPPVDVPRLAHVEPPVDDTAGPRTGNVGDVEVAGPHAQLFMQDKTWSAIAVSPDRLGSRGER